MVWNRSALNSLDLKLLVSDWLKSPLIGMAAANFALVLIVGLIVGAVPPIPSVTRAVADTAMARFVGSQACASCHAREHADWSMSHHKHAMQDATPETVLGNFDDASFVRGSVESRFFKKGDSFFVRTDGPDGRLADFEVRYSFGIFPLQQYLIAMARGRLQALGIAWDARPKDAGGQRWFDLYPGQKLAGGDPQHWTGIDQAWNYQCAYCHSTDLKKNYDAASDSFHTTWSEISVGCEGCHGPASKHLAWADRPGTAEDDSGKGFVKTFDERRGVSWVMDASGQAHRSIPRTSDAEIEACATCHARRQQFSEGENGVEEFFDAFRPADLDIGLYHVDGQQRDEVFNYGSFLQSRMYAAGVTCSDCHNPHSGKLKLAGNAVCSQCHSAERFDTPSHHHHIANSDGAKCTSCHMPTTVYMGVDARHDHSIRIPRPARSISLGVPNACTQCHADKRAAWAQGAIKSWYPTPDGGEQTFAEAFSLGELAAPGAQATLLDVATSSTSSAIVRASALMRLNQFQSRSILKTAAAALTDGNPLVRDAAVALIAKSDRAIRQSLLVPLLGDSTRLVRMSAARALAGTQNEGLSETVKASLAHGLAEYVEAQTFNLERPDAHFNLGGLYRDQGKTSEAKSEFERAIAIDPTFVAASISLADLMRREEREDQAEAVLRRALDRNPRSGQVLHAIGLSLLRQKRIPEALEKLRAAIEAAPDIGRYAYVLAVALHDMGQMSQSLDILKQGVARLPYDRDLLTALTSYELENQDYNSALGYAELLAKLEPERDEISSLVQQLRGPKP